MYTLALKKKIRNLRSSGFMYAEIQLEVNRKIPRSSLNYICKGIVLSDEQKIRVDGVAKAGLVRARKKALIVNKAIFDAKIAQYRKNNQNLRIFMQSREAKLVALAILYLGEGAKWQGHRGLHLGSTSPQIIQLYIRLLNDYFGVEVNSMKGRIQHRADQNPNELLNYWSKITGINGSNFYPSYFDKRTVGKPTEKANYMGVCKISCAGAHFQLELAEIADIIYESVWGIGAAG